MIRHLKTWLKSRNKTVLPYCPAGERVYCVGDIHGQVELLRQLHQQIAQDAAAYSGIKKLIYLGDYVDRGLQSKAVIDELLQNPLPGFENIYLRGNHEQVFLDFIQGEKEVLKPWLAFGGQATLVSYGVLMTKIPTSEADYLGLQTQLRARVPEDHLRFLQRTQSHYHCGNYYFVHAGIDPRLKLAEQCLEAQLWIRDEFIRSRKCFEKIIVHGHTVSETPVFRSNRIGIDTGAYASNCLTCLVLEHDQQSILQAILK